jgi:hypothetical protein
MVLRLTLKLNGRAAEVELVWPENMSGEPMLLVSGRPAIHVTRSEVDWHEKDGHVVMTIRCFGRSLVNLNPGAVKVSTA